MARSLPRIWRVLLVALGVVAPGIGPARADVELPVQYLVERDPFRAVAPGQSLSFELYGDQACGTGPVHTERLVVGQPGVSAERVELEAGQQQTRGTPGAVRLVTTLRPPPLEVALYLKGTGPGIVPVDGEGCQAQLSALTPPGPGGGTEPVAANASQWALLAAERALGSPDPPGPQGSPGPQVPQGPGSPAGPGGGAQGSSTGAGFAFKGEWVSSTDHTANDVVTYEGE